MDPLQQLSPLSLEASEQPVFYTFRPPDLPDEKPLISGVQGSYQMHEDVIVNCSSPRSLPPATLTFYVNDEQVRQTVALMYPQWRNEEFCCFPAVSLLYTTGHY